jgi:protein disulfide-isomerase
MKAIALSPKTKDNFVKTVKDETPTLMLSYADWCPHCVALHPTWEQVKRKLAEQKGIHVVEVEYTHMELLPAALKNVRGFPTIQIVKKGRVSSEFQGDRNASAIMDFALQHASKTAKAPKEKTLKAKKAKST